jgi:hypothetical protein
MKNKNPVIMVMTAILKVAVFAAEKVINYYFR